MPDGAPLPQMQRVHGAARVVLGPAGLERLAQAGSAKAFLPRVHAAAPEVVFLSTAGGLTGGDRLGFALSVAAGCRAVGTTQAAERAYRAAGGTARIEVALEAGVGAELAWLPQETILYDGAALDRRTMARLDRGARLLVCEMVVLGRAAMGETLARVALADRREVWREGRPALIEPLAFGDGALARSGGPAMLGGARAFATVALVAPGAEDAARALREVLPEGAAASGWDGKCVARILAPGARELRRAVAAAVSVLGRAPLPRVWAMGGT
jgi:urease accessory protein